MINLSESSLRSRLHAVWVNEIDLWEESASLHEDTDALAQRIARVFETRIGVQAHITEPANYTNHFIVCLAADGWSPSNRALSNSTDFARSHGYSLWLEALVSYYVPAVEITWHVGGFEANEYRQTVLDLADVGAIDLPIASRLEEMTLHLLDDLSEASIERLELSVTSLLADPSWPCPYPWPSAAPTAEGWRLRHYLFDALSE